jgi:hypothetical protein
MLKNEGMLELARHDFPQSIAKIQLFDGQTTAIDRLKGKIGGKSDSLPYDSARLGLQAQVVTGHTAEQDLLWHGRGSFGVRA